MYQILFPRKASASLTLEKVAAVLWQTDTPPPSLSPACHQALSRIPRPNTYPSPYAPRPILIVSIVFLHSHPLQSRNGSPPGSCASRAPGPRPWRLCGSFKNIPCPHIRTQGTCRCPALPALAPTGSYKRKVCGNLRPASLAAPFLQRRSLPSCPCAAFAGSHNSPCSVFVAICDRGSQVAGSPGEGSIS